MCVYTDIYIFFSLSRWEVGMLPARKAVLPPPPGSALHTELPEPGSRRQLWAGAVRPPRRGARRALTAGEEGGGREEDGGWGCLCPRD